MHLVEEIGPHVTRNPFVKEHSNYGRPMTKNQLRKDSSKDSEMLDKVKNFIFLVKCVVHAQSQQNADATHALKTPPYQL